ncbi:uncharacterized protein [Diabrotica undecimpunctata]|uniref:uncharacterized protein n=1 Tax=Diabrotica undecimpunctata TaxID=50387 RepID=UPI003B641372
MTDVAKIIKLRGHTNACITRIQTFVSKNQNVVLDCGQYIARKNVLNETYREYLNLQKELELEDFDKYCSDRDIVEEQYYNLDSYLYEKITQLSAKPVQTQPIVTNVIPSVSTIQNVKLPELKIPFFSGEISEWPSFFDVFTKLITNDKQLSNAQKLIYLKSVLRNEPLKLIDNLEIIDSNFEIAIQNLCNRFENKYLIVNSHLNSLLNAPLITKPNAHALRDFLTQIKSHLAALENLNISNQLTDLILINIFTQKLDYNTKRSFETERNINKLPSLMEFLEFIERKCKILENLVPEYSHSPKQKQPSRFTSLNTVSNNLQYSSNNQTNQDSRSLPTRNTHFQNTRHSQDSQENHNSQNTRQSHNMHDTPNSRTHSNVSRDPNTQSETSSSPAIPRIANQSQSNDVYRASSLSTLSGKKEGLLQTACVTIYDSHNNPVKVRCLTDSASQHSFITEELASRLKCIPYTKSLQISGISEICSTSNKMVDLNIFSNVNPTKHFTLSCAILPTITCKHPQITLDFNALKIPPNIHLADPEFCTPAEVQMLLGADVYFDLLTYGLIKLGPNLPTLTNTHLGYLVGGNVPQSFGSIDSYSILNIQENTQPRNEVSLFVQTQNTDSLVRSFWEIEEISSSTCTPKILTPSEQQAEDIFKSSFKILSSGRFQVDLPFKSPNEYKKLGESFFLAKKRFLNLEQKLIKSDQLYAQYKQFIHEYIALGHCRYVPLSTRNIHSDLKYFIPHHCVLKDSVTNKLRVVFDGSMKTTSNLSLNDIMLPGYTVQRELFDILINFRLFKYCIVADLRHMYRQIRVNPEQVFLLNILWSDSPQEDLKCLQLETVTYGLNNSGFLSTRCLKELAQKHSDKFPLASDALLNCCYIDDVLYGCNDFETLFEIHRQLTECLNLACFSLHKWCANSPEFLAGISHISNEASYVINPENNTNKILGLCWNSHSDHFSVLVPKVTVKDTYTKREVLSLIASIYDPIGLINPVVVSAKLIMRKIWLERSNWDDHLSPNLLTQWNLFLQTLPHLSNLKIPRLLQNSSNVTSTQIHGFSDASLSAYGACVYLRTSHENGFISCNLISSKSRVSPVKVVTLPRLELLGVLLLSNLVTKILSVLIPSQSQINSVNLWTDSEVVLAWINSHPSRWSTFVANRVTQIQELTSNHTWRHVRSKDNPADILSRGATPLQLLDCDLWFNGPQFLSDPHFDFNLFVYNGPSSINVDELPELKRVTHLIRKPDSQLYDALCKFSCFTRLQRAFAYCIRFIHNVRAKSHRRTGPLTPNELSSSELMIIKLTQSHFFSSEIQFLMDNRLLNDKSIRKLNPFLDSSQMIRVGGRLLFSDVSYDQKFPLLMPSKSHIVNLLLTREHRRLLHSGPQNTLSNVRLKFWPLDGLRQIKRIILNCLTCYRFNAQVASQIMANLPRERVQIARPFINVGVDFGGPFPIKTSKLKRAPLTKAYMAVFVCLATRAVHVELISSLSTEAFLLTLKRFIARRGNPSIIFSDNGTNFLVAKNQLKELYELLLKGDTSESIRSFATSCQIQWKFIPPRSPHHGGIWEAAIKSFKYHLVRIMGNSNFTFEELSTVLSQIEAVLNSRPICALSDDPSDFSFLTPGHFLIGSNLMSYPELDLSDIQENKLSLWNKCTRIQQHMWKVWTRDYLNRLQNRPKWFTPQVGIKPDDLVLLKDENSPPLKWPIARVVETYPGKDNKVRTPEGLYVRSIAKLCPLPMTHLQEF